MTRQSMSVHRQWWEGRAWRVTKGKELNDFREISDLESSLQLRFGFPRVKRHCVTPSVTQAD